MARDGGSHSWYGAVITGDDTRYQYCRLCGLIQMRSLRLSVFHKLNPLPTLGIAILAVSTALIKYACLETNL